MQRFGGAQDLVSDARTQERRRHHVDAPTMEEFREFAFDRDEATVWRVAGQEFDEDIHVAVGSEVVGQQVEAVRDAASVERRGMTKRHPTLTPTARRGPCCLLLVVDRHGVDGLTESIAALGGDRIGLPITGRDVG